MTPHDVLHKHIDETADGVRVLEARLLPVDRLHREQRIRLLISAPGRIASVTLKVSHWRALNRAVEDALEP